MSFKVVLVSNFDDPMVDDKLMSSHVFTYEKPAQIDADIFNESNGTNAKYYAQVKPADYELYKFVP